jgi:hypothetical protein|tara:strand:- start:2611 stop:3444 length:834 start_codon:yes stop_codon:yes gene_type:complete
MATISINRQLARKLYVAFKYIVFILLSINVFVFLQEELDASAHLFAGGMNVASIIEGYAATIDTAAWVILLLLFELETEIIEDEKIKGPTKWAIHWTRWLCSAFIIYALYGYIAKLIGLSSYQLTEIASLCSQSIDWSFMTTLDEFTAVAVDNCAALAAPEYFQLIDKNIIASQETLSLAKWLAWVDVVNASTWVLIVIMLEIDVRIQLHKVVFKTWEFVSGIAKIILYSILFIAAIIWGIDGQFIDTWDASLWLVAFVFIEMNVFDWQEEIAAEQH